MATGIKNLFGGGKASDNPGAAGADPGMCNC
jgi:hypothetical protein